MVKYCVMVRRRWAKYFDQVLNVADVREANIKVLGNWRTPMLGDLGGRAILLLLLLKEVGNARLGESD